MSSKCPSCLGDLRRKSPWRSVCDGCGLYVSELEPGPGKAFDGIETLRKHNFRLVLDAVETIRPLRGQRLLEVGVAKGWFLDAATKRGAIVSGIEPVAADAAIARQAGFDVEEGLFPASPRDRGPYDLVVFNDVFEHLPDPVEAVRAASDLLSEGGLLVVNIPSSSGVIFRTAAALDRLGFNGPYDRMWQRGLPSPHMTYFSPDNLRALVEGHTTLRRRKTEPLPSLHRDGLRARIDSSPTGLPKPVVFAAAWAMSFVMPLLPSDIELSIFAKGA